MEEHIRTRRSFATETTLRTTVAIDQATRAKAAGFFTSIIYIGTGDVEINVERVRLRALTGGHSAPPDAIRDTYAPTPQRGQFFVFVKIGSESARVVSATYLVEPDA